nr:MAG TPA: hypothetical protein [Caudoviricetes sp.]
MYYLWYKEFVFTSAFRCLLIVEFSIIPQAKHFKLALTILKHKLGNKFTSFQYSIH